MGGGAVPVCGSLRRRRAGVVGRSVVVFTLVADVGWKEFWLLTAAAVSGGASKQTGGFPVAAGRWRCLVFRVLMRAVAGSAAVAVMWAAMAVPAWAAANDLPTVVHNLTVWIVGILAGVATLFLTIGGARYLMAGGDPAEVERAKSALKSAALGYALAVLAPVLLQVLRAIVGG